MFNKTNRANKQLKRLKESRLCLLIKLNAHNKILEGYRSMLIQQEDLNRSLRDELLNIENKIEGLAIEGIKNAKDTNEIREIWNNNPVIQSNRGVKSSISIRKKELDNVK